MNHSKCRKQKKQTRPSAGQKWGKLWAANQGSLFLLPSFSSPCSHLHFIPVPPGSLVEELQSAGVAVVAVDLAVRLVEGGGVGEGREGVVAGGREGVSWWREKRFGIILRSGERWRAVVLIGGGGTFPGAQGLSL